MNNFGKKNLYYAENENSEPKGGCNCAAACNGHCKCNCSGGMWSYYTTNQSKGAQTFPATTYRSPTGI